ncbi:MAG: hypothetical protein ACXVFM_15965 [Solirubrobacteraceae bacterium]
MLNLAPSPTELLSKTINAEIDAALEADNAKQKRRHYLGASRLGEECMRKLWYEHNVPEKATPFPGRALRRFELGHRHEDMTAAWLVKAGFNLATIDHITGEQFSFMDSDAPIGGHTDGIIIGGPVALPYPLLWEHKVMKSTSWAKLVKDGVEKSHPVYYAQCVIYMEKLELGACLFTALNTDTSGLHFELVKAHGGRARALLNRGRAIVTATSEHDMPRCATVETDFRCRFCSFQEHCWRPDDRVAKPIPSVLPAWARK